MAKIDIDRACETDMADDYLNKKIDSGSGGTGGVTQQYVDEQDAIVQANVDAEAVTREEADTTLQTNIDAVQVAVTTEATARTDADTALQTLITTETTDRTTADAYLQSQIDDLGTGGGSTSTGEDVFYTVTGDVDVDCSTIPDGYNAIEMSTLTTSRTIYNLADSNIRYIKINSTLIYGATLTDHLTIADLTQNIYLYPYGTNGTYIFRSLVPIGESVHVLTWDDLPFIKQRDSLFFIRFNSDLTYITEYFNTDEFLIPFDSAGVYDNDKIIYIYQPTTVDAGTFEADTSVYVANTGWTSLSKNYLLKAPIHSPCIPTLQPKVIESTECYIDTIQMMATDLLYDGKSSWSKDVEYPTIIVNRVGIGGYDFSWLKEMIKKFRLLSALVYEEDGARINLSLSFVINDILHKGTMYYYLASGATPPLNRMKESMGFALFQDSPTDPIPPHALTSISYFDKNDNPIPTGYVPTPTLNDS